MKTMKIFLVALFAGVLTANANDKPITVDQLPAAARQFLQTYFKEAKVTYVTKDCDFFDKSYEVRFMDGAKVEFRGDGEWDNIDCGKSAVPAGIVPAQIAEYVKNNHSGQAIVKIDRDRKDYEVGLQNGLELKFDSSFRIIGYDD